MSKVLFVQNCFVPDENQCRRLERSLESLLDYSDGFISKNEYHFVLGGHIADEFKDRIRKLITEFTERQESSRFFKEIRLIESKINAGKGRITNFSVDHFCKNISEVDYLFMFDNDIIFKNEEKDLVQILIEQMTEIDAIGSMKYPVMSCNFEEHQVHNEGVLDFGYPSKHGLIKCSTGRFGCIGGGCWLVKKNHWDKVGGYCADAVYGKDDGKFYLDTITMKDRMVALSYDQYVIHPADTDQEYNRFKADTNINRVRKMNYDELSDDSGKFWSNRK